MIRRSRHLRLIRGTGCGGFCAGVWALAVAFAVWNCGTHAAAQKGVAPEPRLEAKPKAADRPADAETPPSEPSSPPSAGTAPKWEQPSAVDHASPPAEEDTCPGDLPPSEHRRRVFDFLRRSIPEQRIPDPRVEQNWLAHPFSVGLFLGTLQGSTLMVDWVEQRNGYLGGIRAGYDFDEYLGLEFRHAFGSCRIVDSERAIVAAGAGHLMQARYSDRQLYEITFLWYPVGGGRWQPYVIGGIGIAEVQFADIFGNSYAASVPSIPVGVGMKYHCTDRVVLRLECADDMVFTRGSGMVDTIHDFSILAGIEFRFGGSRRSYWPWSPAGSLW